MKLNKATAFRLAAIAILTIGVLLAGGGDGDKQTRCDSCQTAGCVIMWCL